MRTRSGFIGSHLCEALLASGNRVLALDNYITGSPDNVRALQDNPDFELSQVDVNHGVFIDGDVRYVLHFASPASPPQYDSNPIHTLKVGTVGTMNMLGLARAKEATFLLASTSEVYGDPLVHPQPESYWGNVNPIGPRGCYDEAKRCGEAFAMAYHRAHQVDTRIVRIFNTHGPRMQVSDGRAVPNFMAQAIRGEPLTVYGDGSQTRSLCYVSDLVSGVLAALERGDELPVNLGNPQEITVLELAETIIRLARSKSRVFCTVTAKSRPGSVDGSSAPMRPICVVAASAARLRRDDCARSAARPRLASQPPVHRISRRGPRP